MATPDASVPPAIASRRAVCATPDGVEGLLLQHDLFHRIARGQHRHHDVAVCRCFDRARMGRRAALGQTRRRAGRAVPHVDGETLVEQTLRDTGAHGAGAEQRDCGAWGRGVLVVTHRFFCLPSSEWSSRVKYGRNVSYRIIANIMGSRAIPIEKKRGRPRSNDTQKAIFKAAPEGTRRAGRAVMSIDGVAERAGVGKASIYRRWPSKGALAFDAVVDTIIAV